MDCSDFPLSAWTMRRCNMRKFCPKAALLHYRESRIFPENCDGEELHSLRLMRRKSTLDSTLRRLLRTVMRELFYRGLERGECDSLLAGCVLEKFRSEFTRMLLHPEDENIPYILELDDPHCRISELQKRAENAISERCRKLEAGAFGELLDVPVESRRRTAAVLTVTVNELCCYCAPVCVLEKAGKLWFIESGHCGDENALLHRFFAYNILGREPQNVHSFVLDDFTGELRKCGDALQISEVLRKISADAAVWDELLKTDIADVPVNTENCLRCKFRDFCKKSG